MKIFENFIFNCTKIENETTIRNALKNEIKFFLDQKTKKFAVSRIWTCAGNPIWSLLASIELV